MKRIAVIVPIVLVLSACGSEPSEADIKAALEKSVAGTNQLMSDIGGADNPVTNLFKVEYKSVKKLGCKADGDNAYKCDVEAEVKSVMGEKKIIEPVRFVKASDGWTATE